MFPLNIPRPRGLAARLAYDEGVNFEIADGQTQRDYRRRAASLIRAGEFEEIPESEDDVE